MLAAVCDNQTVQDGLIEGICDRRGGILAAWHVRPQALPPSNMWQLLFRVSAALGRAVMIGDV